MQNQVPKKQPQAAPKPKKHEIDQISQLQLQLSISESGPSKNEISGSPSPIKQDKRNRLTNLQKIENVKLSISNTKNLDEQQESNLLDSTIKDKKKEILTESVSLNQQKGGEGSKIGKVQVSESSREIILQAEIIELQMRCTGLMGLIHNIRKEFNISLSDIQNLQCNLQSKLDVSSHDDSSLSLSYCNTQKNQKYAELTESKDLNKQIQSFNNLEKHVSEYRAQLRAYQMSVKEIQINYDNKIQNLQNSINGLQEQILKKDKQIQSERKSNRQMVKKNEQLILEVQRLSSQQVSPKKKSNENLPFFNSRKNQSPASFSKQKKNLFHRQNFSPIEKEVQVMPFLNTFSKNYQNSPDLDISINSKYCYMYRNNFQTPSTNPQQKHQQYQSFSLKEYQGCIKQMETIIQKLVNGIQFQKKTKEKLMIQINRLCQVVRESEGEIQDKNCRIFQLEKEIINRQVQVMRKEENTLEPKIRKVFQENKRALSSQEIKSMKNSLTKDRYEKNSLKKMQDFPNLRRHYSQNEHLLNTRNQQKNCYQDYYEYKQGMRSSKNLPRRNQHNDSRRNQNIYRLNKPRPSNTICEDYTG